MESKKCEDKSNQLLIEAEVCVGETDYHEALKLLNKSLCSAPPDSPNVPLIYAKRAKIYQQLNQMEKCCENVELFNRLRSSIDDISIIEETSKLGQNLNGHENDDNLNFFKLSHPSHKKLPFIIDCLKAQDTWKYGRCVITQKNLNPGDIVAGEEPFFRMLNKESRYSRCSNCMKSNLMSLIPCPHHCTSTMFCSTLCLDKAWQRFHKFECSALDDSLNNDNEYDIMVLKTVFEALDICGSIDNLKAFLGETERNLTAFDFDLSPDIDNEKKLLKAVYSLRKGPSSPEDLAMAEWIVDSYPVLTSLWKTKLQKEFLKNFVIRIMGIVDRNSYILYSPSLMASYVDEEVGSGVFPFASLINHSCSPNLYRTFVDNKQVFIVKMPIAAGEQLFVGYHGNFAVCERQERQKVLLSDFQFKCGCKACTSDYPLMSGLKRYDKGFKSPPAKVVSLEDAKRVLSENFDYVKEKMKEFPFPSFEICTVMQNSFRQLQFIAGKKFLVEKL